MKKYLSSLVQFTLVLSLFAPFLSAINTAHAATTLFSDGFESNNFTNWTASDSDWDIISDNHSGSKGAEVKDNGIFSDELRKNIPTSGYQNISLSYWYKIPSGLSSLDHLKVQWSIDGITWNTIVDYASSATISNWVLATHNLTGSENNSGFRFRFLAEDLESNDKFRLDDVSLTGDVVPTTASLTVIKNVINNNGGTAVASDFTMTLTSQNNFAGNANGTTFSTLPPGSYTIGENSLSGYFASYSGDCNSSGEITLIAGDIKTCTITNDDIAPTVTLNKVVINNNGGNAGVNDFGLSIGGTSVTSGQILPVQANVPIELLELSLTGYSFVSITGDEGCPSQLGGTVTLSLGQNISCTITNDDKEPGTLTIIKNVINDNPEGYQGTAVAGDFTLSVTGGNPDPSSVSGNETGVTVTIDADTQYSVSETGGPTSSYGMSMSEGCSGTMQEGGSATCTITNNDNPPTTGGLTVVKVVTNDNGGTAVISDFTLYVTDESQSVTQVTSGQNNQFAGGSYMVSETGVSMYSSTFSGDCNSDGMITIVNGESKVCTITNDDIAPTVTLNKVVINNNGGSAGINDFGLSIGGTSVTSGQALPVQANVPIELLELSLSGYSFVSITGDEGCPSQLGGTVTLSLGQNISCTITNDDNIGSITVIKHVINDNNGTKTAEDFTIHVNIPQQEITLKNNSIWDKILAIFETSKAYAVSLLYAPASFTGNENGTEVYFENSTEYTVTEDPSDGYTTTMSEDCSGSITGGQHKVCTITNNDIAPTPTHRGGGQYIGGSVLGASTGQVLGAETSCGIYLSKYFKMGRKNDVNAVKLLQEFLNKTYPNAGIVVNGIFGSMTDKYVRQFQLDHKDKILTPWGLKKPTGIVYLTTVTEINNIMCPILKLPIPALIPPSANPDFPKL